MSESSSFKCRQEVVHKWIHNVTSTLPSVLREVQRSSVRKFIIYHPATYRRSKERPHCRVLYRLDVKIRNRNKMKYGFKAKVERLGSESWRDSMSGSNPKSLSKSVRFKIIVHNQSQMHSPNQNIICLQGWLFVLELKVKSNKPKENLII